MSDSMMRPFELGLSSCPHSQSQHTTHFFAVANAFGGKSSRFWPSTDDWRNLCRLGTKWPLLHLCSSLIWKKRAKRCSTLVLFASCLGCTRSVDRLSRTAMGSDEQHQMNRGSLVASTVSPHAKKPKRCVNARKETAQAHSTSHLHGKRRGGATDAADLRG